MAHEPFDLLLHSDGSFKRDESNMSDSISAIYPWLGYKVQEYRLVHHLLNSKRGMFVGLEVLDDVYTEKDAQTLLEQDKASFSNRNPLSNLSTDLWKTLHNWIQTVDSHNLELSNTLFVMYTNRYFTSDIFKLLISVENEVEAETNFQKIRKIIEKKDNLIPVSIAKYYDKFVSYDSVKRNKLLINLSYEYGSETPYKDLKAEYEARNNSVIEQSKNVLDSIVGWTSNTLIELATSKEATIISAEAFGRRLTSIERKYDTDTILNFFCERSIDDTEVKNELGSVPIYVQQLKIIDLDEEEIETAVINKLEAKDAVTEWTIQGGIQESSYKSYDDALKRAWKRVKNITSDNSSIINDKAKGRTVFNMCLEKGEVIKLANKQVEPFFSEGCYQMLADKPELGWHPNYKEFLKGNDNAK